FAQRRRKTTPLTDVAGMLRSFEYAKGDTARRIGEARQTERDELETLLADWRDQARQTFLDAYRAAMDGCPSYPSDPDDAARLIELASIEKLLYEIRYELNNRPDWLVLPWSGLRAMLEGE